MQSQLANDFAEEALDALAYSPLFFDFSLEELPALLRDLELVVFAEGDLLTEQGRPSDCLYVLVSGQVVLTFGDAHDSLFRPTYLTPPDIIGEVGLILNAPRSATTQAIGPVKAVKLSRANFHRLIADKPQFSLSILRILAARLEHAQPAAPPSASDPQAVSATAAEHTLYRTAQAILERLPPEASAMYDLAQTLDARSARNVWFDGASKAYRTAADAIIIDLAAQAACDRAAQRGPLGLLEATTHDGQRLTVSDYLWPLNPYLSPTWQLHTRPMPLLGDGDDIYRCCLLALVDTLAADTYDVLSRLAQLPAQTPLRTIHDFYQLTNDFSVRFMSFSRLQRQEHPKPADQRNNPLISFVTGIETGMRIMVRLMRLVFDKFVASVHRLPTEEQIHPILVPQLRQSHHLLTLLARGNLIDVNTRNRVLMGHTGPWFDPACFDYKHLASAGEASWDGSLAHLRDYRLYPSATAVRQFDETPPAKEIVRAVGGHRRTDGCPARAPLHLVSEAQQLGILQKHAAASGGGAKEDANAILTIFYHLLVPLAPHVYEVDLRQRRASAEKEHAAQRPGEDKVVQNRARAQRIQQIRQELELQHPGISKKALDRLVARTLAESNR
jgi:CRP-like cAMP-binding protein